MKDLTLNPAQEKLFDAIRPHIKEDKMDDFEALLGKVGKEIEEDTGRSISQEEPVIMDKVFSKIMPTVMTFIKPISLMKVNGLFKHFVNTGEVEED